MKDFYFVLTHKKNGKIVVTLLSKLEKAKTITTCKESEVYETMKTLKQICFNIYGANAYFVLMED